MPPTRGTEAGVKRVRTRTQLRPSNGCFLQPLGHLIPWQALPIGDYAAQNFCTSSRHPNCTCGSFLLYRVDKLSCWAGGLRARVWGSANLAV